MKNFLMLLIFCAPVLLSQPQNPEWRNYTSSNSANYIMADGDYLWLCTDGGLVKFNKLTNESVFFNKGNSLIPSIGIHRIDIDQQGYKWIATRNGIAKFKDDEWYIYKMDNSGLPHNHINTLLIDNQVKWFGTRGGLVKFDGLNWTVFNTSNSPLPNNNVTALYMRNDTLLIGTAGGLLKKKDDSYSFISSTQNMNINGIDVDLAGNIWLSTWNGLFKILPSGSFEPVVSFGTGFIKIDDRNQKWFAVSSNYPMTPGIWMIDSSGSGGSVTAVNSAVPVSYFSSILIDQNGIKWFGSYYGLLKFADGTGTLFTTSNSKLWQQNLSGMYMDRYSRKWFYHWIDIPLTAPFIPQGFLSLFHNNTWEVFNAYNSSVTEGGVNCVAEGFGNEIYVSSYLYGYQTKLYKFQSGVWTEITTPSYEIKYLWFDNVTNRLYVNFSSGLYKFNGTAWESISGFPLGCQVNFSKRIGDAIWMTTNLGLLKYTTPANTFTLYTTTNSGLPHNMVNSIDTDESGNLWIGTSKGLVKYNGSSWIVYDRLNSPLTNDDISSVVVDTSNYIYLGNNYSYQYPSSGLIRFDGSNWRFYNKNNSGFPDNVLYDGAIQDLVHDNGKIWIATTAGVGVYDRFGIPVPVELVSFTAKADGKNIRLEWSTASEINNKGFEVERKFNSNEWIKIAFIEGKGTTTEPTAYSYLDINAGSGTYKYRLKQLDYNGDYTYSPEAEVITGLPENFSLYQNYPNPFNPSTKIRFALNSRNHTKLSVVDLLGKERVILDEIKDAGEYEIDFNASGMAAGVYFYSLKSGDNFQVKKFILLK